MAITLTPTTIAISIIQNPRFPEPVCSSGKVCFTNRLGAVFALVKLEQVSTRERIPQAGL
jgi:hypothetical protein